MLRLTAVTKDYPSPAGPLRVLDRVTFALEPGAAAAVCGPSGSGKTTLLAIVGSLEPPTSGRVVVDGCDPFCLSPAKLAAFRNATIGFVFQDSCLLPQCSVLENVLIPTLVGPTDRDAPQRARDLIAEVGLSERLDHRPAHLSGGERQRAAIARALIRRPRLLLCDEPTGNLDATTAERIAALLGEVNRRHGTTMIVVTHSAALAERLPLRFELSGGALRRAAVV